MVKTKTKTLVELMCEKDKFYNSETKKLVGVKPIGAPVQIPDSWVGCSFDVGSHAEYLQCKIETKAPEGADAFVRGEACDRGDGEYQSKSCIAVQYYKIMEK